VLFITTDQHRFDAVGFMGSAGAQTPNLDRLAASEVVFERCYVTNPVCMPSRASLLTGQFPDAHGVRR
jgi:arylsulfatase